MRRSFAAAARRLSPTFRSPFFHALLISVSFLLPTLRSAFFFLSSPAAAHAR